MRFYSYTMLFISTYKDTKKNRHIQIYYKLFHKYFCITHIIATFAYIIYNIKHKNIVETNMKRKETEIIAIANHKGGVGKTTTTASISSILADKGYKVLMIDLDAQANLTASFPVAEIGKTVYDALVEKDYSTPLPVYRLSDNLHIVPAAESLAMAETQLSQRMARETILKKLIKPIRDEYDFIFIDCPPSLGLLPLNAFTACTGIIVPIVAEYLPFKGLVMIEQFIKAVQENLNEQAEIKGILITRWEATKLGRQIEEGLRANLGMKVFKTKIRKNVSIAEAPLASKNIVKYAPSSNGASDYLSFTEEFLRNVYNK